MLESSPRMSCFHRSPHRSPNGRRPSGDHSAFTLLELLIVIGIMSVMMALLSPVMSAFKSSGDINKASGDIQGILEQARSYAMANKTYVYAGLQEVDLIQANQNLIQSGIGRVGIAVIASVDGTQPWSITTNLSSANATNTTLISKLRYFDNLHITNSGSLKTGANMTNRPSSSVLDLSANTSQVTFNCSNAANATTYAFTKVIEFDPRGVARVQTNSSPDTSINSTYIEIPLLPCHGNQAPPASGNQAAIQIDGITGAVRVYRP